MTTSNKINIALTLLNVALTIILLLMWSDRKGERERLAELAQWKETVEQQQGQLVGAVGQLISVAHRHGEMTNNVGGGR